MPSPITAQNQVSIAEPASHASWCQGLMPATAALPNTTPTAANDCAADDDDGREPDSMAPGQNATANAVLRRITGQRLMKARALAGLTQTEAAREFGYKTSAQLSLWEAGRRLVPMGEIVKAGRVYMVSMDFLLGASDEPERDASLALRQACLAGVRRQLERVAEVTVDTVARHAKLIGPDAANFRTVVDASDALIGALGNFMRLNSAFFDSMRGSATVLRLASELEVALANAQEMLRRHDEHEFQMRQALAALGREDVDESADDL